MTCNPYPSQLARLPWPAKQRLLLSIVPNRMVLSELRTIGRVPLPVGHSRRRRDAPLCNDNNQHWFVSLWRLGSCGLGQRQLEVQLLKLLQLGYIEKRADGYRVRRYRITLAGVTWLESQR